MFIRQLGLSVNLCLSVMVDKFESNTVGTTPNQENDYIVKSLWIVTLSPLGFYIDLFPSMTWAIELWSLRGKGDNRSFWSAVYKYIDDCTEIPEFDFFTLCFTSTCLINMLVWTTLGPECFNILKMMYLWNRFCLNTCICDGNRNWIFWKNICDGNRNIAVLKISSRKLDGSGICCKCLSTLSHPTKPWTTDWGERVDGS